MDHNGFSECEYSKCKTVVALFCDEIENEIGEDDPRWIFDPKKPYKSDDEKPTEQTK